jgi:hypothetical protein
MHSILTHSERAELFDALVERFRNGEIGPMTFRARASALNIPRDEIEEKRNAHIDENAANFVLHHRL